MLSTDQPLNYIEGELEYFRSATAFREISVIAALDFCAQHNMCAPKWLAAEAAELLIELVKSQKVDKRGRAGGYIAEYQRHLTDLDRWDAVIQVRELRDKAFRELEIVRERPHLAKTAKRLVDHFRKLKGWLRQGTFACAALLVVANGGIRVTAAAVRRSYRRIEEKNRTIGFRSCVFDPDFLRKIGIGEKARPGRKCVPIYDLTP